MDSFDKRNGTSGTMNNTAYSKNCSGQPYQDLLDLRKRAQVAENVDRESLEKRIDAIEAKVSALWALALKDMGAV